MRGRFISDGRDTEAAIVAAGLLAMRGFRCADLDELYPGVERLIAKRSDYLIVSRDIPGRLTGEADLREVRCAGFQKQYGCMLTAATLAVMGWWPGDGSGFFYRPAFRAERQSILRARAIFSTQVVRSTDFCGDGRWSGRSTLPARRPR